MKTIYKRKVIEAEHVSSGLINNAGVSNSTPLPPDPVTDVCVCVCVCVNGSLAQCTACCVISDAFSH